ncbi:MAG: hypothetical protein KDC62_02090 [Aequorivita sp.]|nr:hypothetical protein [Aequorivita sp.]
MKKINIILFFTIALLTIGCETYDDYQPRKTTIGFVPSTRNINGVPNNSYKSIDVEIFINDVSDQERTFNIISIPAVFDPTVSPQIESAPENYTFDSSVTISANSRNGVITVSGTNVSLGDDDEYFSLAVEGSDNVVSGSPITVRLRH